MSHSLAICSNKCPFVHLPRVMIGACLVLLGACASTTSSGSSTEGSAQGGTSVFASGGTSNGGTEGLDQGGTSAFASGGTNSGGDMSCVDAGSTVTADVDMPPGTNYAVASFRLWYPQGVDKVKGILVLLAGLNGDARDDVTSTEWQQFANTEGFALMGCFFQNYDKDESVLENQYSQDVSLGSGQAMLDAITSLSTQTGRSELANAPLLLWGISAGGQFNYDFACFDPDRVIAFVVNKGGYYHYIPAAPGAMKVPSLMFIGGEDTQQRIDAINEIFKDGRTVGAPWALTVEKTMGHDVGDSMNLSLGFFHAILPLRLPPNGVRPLLDIDQTKGYIGDLDALTISPATTTSPVSLERTAWLPDEATATIWQTVVNK